ncbi:hypothetical protein CN307_32690 [Bacillus cereus]|uniref:Uncharacterized protein n=1 Tax=Bacillus cereus TaxID=1396 RepID=A0A2A8ZQ22_BACCE|nr:hypothetical protein CN307_32690 [Bacillus cereus]
MSGETTYNIHMSVSFKCEEKINKRSTENQQNTILVNKLERTCCGRTGPLPKMPMRKINVTNIVSINENSFQVLSIEK